MEAKLYVGKRSWLKLTREDLARLNKRWEELSVVLRQWQRYSRMQADRIISSWLYNHGRVRSFRAWRIEPKRSSKPLTRPDA
ncbi:MAG TPA: hypothetical protein VLG46_05760 [Anaerolineae bacterium]|nr:hypothetical protein [Anaerolineae bacterium]